MFSISSLFQILYDIYPAKEFPAKAFKFGLQALELEYLELEGAHEDHQIQWLFKLSAFRF